MQFQAVTGGRVIVLRYYRYGRAACGHVELQRVIVLKQLPQLCPRKTRRQR